MNRDFDTFIKQHLEDILCQAEKEHSLAQLVKGSKKKPLRLRHRSHPLPASPPAQLQDCAISPGFSYTHL